MADSITRVAKDKSEISKTLGWANEMMLKGIVKGPVAVTLGRPEEPRSLDQNAKSWAMYNDLSQQLDWHGQKMPPEYWKDLLSHEWKAQAFIPAISGGFVAVGVRTSKMRKREMAELITLVEAFGNEHGVRWSDPALKAFEEYREAQEQNQ